MTDEHSEGRRAVQRGQGLHLIPRPQSAAPGNRATRGRESTIDIFRWIQKTVPLLKPPPFSLRCCVFFSKLRKNRMQVIQSRRNDDAVITASSTPTGDYPLPYLDSQ